MDFNLQKLRYERMSRRISQEHLADAINVHRSTYIKKESGSVAITVDEFAIIIRTLGIPTNEAINFFTHEIPEREQDSI